MIVARNRPELATALKTLRDGGASVSLVPTMGALHDGHLGLLRCAASHADAVAASIFVNPTQFAPGEDFETYPRDEAGDLGALEKSGCDLVYLPDPAEMYPAGEETRVVPGLLAAPLDGASRPGFFTGVCTVVTKLFAHVRPDVAVFGEKDYQQLLVLRRMTVDLGLDVEIVGAPIARADDGLALSSRNRYLSGAERRTAVRLPETLNKVCARIRGGVATDTAVIQGLQTLEEAGMRPDYLEVRRADDLAPLPGRPLRRAEIEQARIFAAAFVGPTRLIDNRAL